MGHIRPSSSSSGVSGRRHRRRRYGCCSHLRILRGCIGATILCGVLLSVQFFYFRKPIVIVAVVVPTATATANISSSSSSSNHNNSATSTKQLSSTTTTTSSEATTTTTLKISDDITVKDTTRRDVLMDDSSVTTTQASRDGGDGSGRQLPWLPSSSSLSSTTSQGLWWEDLVRDTSRIYPPKTAFWRIGDEDDDDTTDDEGSTNTSNPNNGGWCQPTTTASSSKRQGIVYVSIPKTSSSTNEGIALRIAHAVYERHFHNYNTSSSSSSSCQVYAQHGTFKSLLSMHQEYRNYNSTLLWTTIRDPRRRAISEYYHFEVARKNASRYGISKLQFLQSKKGYQYSYLLPQKQFFIPHQSTQTSITQQQVSTILKQFDFIGITERMEESLVVMKLLFGLHHSDILVLSSKRNGNYDGGRYHGTCFRIPSPVVDDPIENTYWNDPTSDFYTEENPDYLLFASVNESLDKTIAWLEGQQPPSSSSSQPLMKQQGGGGKGIGWVQREVEIHKQLQQLVNEQCFNKAIFPCSNTGQRQIKQSETSCYQFDSGCGYTCIDEVLASIAIAHQ